MTRVAGRFVGRPDDRFDPPAVRLGVRGLPPIAARVATWSAAGRVEDRIAVAALRVTIPAWTHAATLATVVAGIADRSVVSLPC